MIQDTQPNYDSAVSKGWWRQIASRLTGKSTELQSFDEVCDQHALKSRHELGACVVSINQIIGSVGRCGDFDCAFYPRKTTTRDRWMSIARASYQNIALPLVELYKVGEAYFVKDGHHRISVARASGQDFIDATVVVIEMQ